MKRKMLLCLLSAALFVFSFVSTAFADIVTVGTGDVDGNESVSADDARAALRYSVGLEKPTVKQFLFADVDFDGSVTAEDARYVLRISVGLEKPVSYELDTGLYKVAHNFYDSSKGYGVDFKDSKLTRNSPLSLGGMIEAVYGTAGKWCCFYTIRDVFRPTLREAGYSDSQINKLAPIYFPKDKITTAVKNIAASATSEYKTVLDMMSKSVSLLDTRIVPFYIPSVLMDYYRNAPSDVCETYTFHEYYDDVIEDKLITPDSDPTEYTPKVGDIVFMSNKESTYAYGYPTVDHTAQIIAVKNDGTFLCTEGSIILPDNPDNLPRVRERWYKYSSKKGTFIYEKNSIVIVLACVRPAL